MKATTVKTVGKKIISVLVLCACVAGIVEPLFHALPAEAAYPVYVTGGIGTHAEWTTVALEKGQLTKDIGLDSIAWMAANLILHEMSKQIVTWINSGFKGSPAFVTNLDGFLTDIGDQVAGDFIWKNAPDTLGFLCSPFRLDVQLALDMQYKKSRDYKNECRLSGIIANVDNFFNGDFLAGGWDGWMAVTTHPENNPYGAFFTAQAEMSARISNARGQEFKLLEFSKGFLSTRDANGNITTPGAVIETQLNNTLASGQNRLMVADEINEVLGALMSQLVTQAFAGAGGLLGLTGSSGGSSSGGSNYYDQIANDPNQLGFQTDNNPIQDAIPIEQEYLRLRKEAAASILGAQNYKTQHYGTSSQCGSDTLSKNLTDALDQALHEASAATSTIMALNNLVARYTTKTTPSEMVATRIAVMKEFNELQARGALHNEYDNFIYREETLAGINSAITTYKMSIDNECRRYDGD